MSLVTRKNFFETWSDLTSDLVIDLYEIIENQRAPLWNRYELMENLLRLALSEMISLGPMLVKRFVERGFGNEIIHACIGSLTHPGRPTPDPLLKIALFLMAGT